MGISKEYDDLNQQEKDFVFWHPIAALNFRSNSKTAIEEAKKRFNYATRHNGSIDAFRHCYWSALNARDQGPELAKQFGDAKKSRSDNPENEKKMDLHNNAVGYSIGQFMNGASDRHLAVLCVQAWAAGKLIQIDTSAPGDLTYSNKYEKVYEQ